ncbi:hypothetical protein TNIN_471941 [Trichonephila inaurata madagascariensis]|uniref:Uncharacterized protein n=1 Tax=Trichonephila inaurata madagascariensis TaxID=2747483 RepID=A0A8X6MAK7_9ARAC|nr:hypothetical protein TNIN_471941 [Trichonephila inaurata madagascariensis]
MYASRNNSQTKSTFIHNQYFIQLMTCLVITFPAQKKTLPPMKRGEGVNAPQCTHHRSNGPPLYDVTRKRDFYCPVLHCMSLAIFLGVGSFSVVIMF